MPCQKNTSSPDNIFEVIVAGAGVAGCAAALFLQKAGYRVCLLRHQVNERYKAGESLPPVANKLLQELGLWEKFKMQGHLPCYGNRSAWGSPHPQTHDFLSDVYGYGWHIDRLAFEQLLLTEVLEKNIFILSSTELPEVVAKSPEWQLRANEITVAAPFLIDAGGRNSRLSMLMRLRRKSRDKQLAVFGFFEGISISTQFSFIEAVPQGWWYTAPLPAGRVVTTLFTLPGCYERKSTPEVTLQYQLQSNPQLQQMLLHKKPVHSQFYNAGSSVLEQMCAENYVAIGDAALTFDPISSHGMVMAMASARDATAAYHKFREGDARAFIEYDSLLQRTYTQYEQNRRQIYASEKRWLGETYWKQRRL